MLEILKKRYTKFMLGGAYLFAFEYLTTIFFTEILNFQPHMAYMMALLLGGIFLFQYHSKVTFKESNLNKKTIFLKFIATYAISFILNAFFVYLLTQRITYLIAIPLTNIILSTMLYFTYKKVVFVK